jgi:hypothetical protein
VSGSSSNEVSSAESTADWVCKLALAVKEYMLLSQSKRAEEQLGMWRESK